MKLFYKKIGAMALAVAMALSISGCGGNSASSLPDDKPSVYPFVNTLKEPEDNAMLAVEAPALVEQIKQKAAEVNPEIVGWLQVPGTDINQPVVQTYNNSKYMRLTYEGKYSFQGCYWVDYECTVGNRTSESRNTIIYGHNTAVTQDDPNGLDFAQLLRFADEDFAASHPYIFFSTGEEDLVWEIFAVMYTDTKFRYIEMIDSRIDTLVSEGKARSEFNYDVEVDPASDKILTLSTCTAKYGYVGGDARARFVVMARLVEPDRELAPTVGLEKNASIKAPQL
ncbi:MAG: class B sortase [Oscillospiraceae bacterium]|nr:class B sortase [Oscillospiraceae bacterium]